MKRWLSALGLLAVLLITACSRGNGTIPAPNQAIGPSNAPTSTIPAVLSSPIAAVPVSLTSGTATAQAGGSTGQSNYYIVKQGDTLSAIAQKLGISLQQLEASNNGVNSADLHIGQKLNFPQAASSTPTAQATGPAATTTASTASAGGVGRASTYKVRSGDTACKIAAAHQVSIQELAQANGTGISGLTQLKIGQTLSIPPATGSPPGC